MKAVLLALLLISQPQKFQISGGIGYSGYTYSGSDWGSNSDKGVTFRVSFDYWDRDFLAFGIDSGYQYFGDERIIRNIYFIPNFKIGTTNLGKNKLFIQAGIGYDVVGRDDLLGGGINDESSLAFYLGIGFMRNFDKFHTGAVFNYLYVPGVYFCGGDCPADIHFPTISIFFGFGSVETFVSSSRK